jgi:hypothetical protein
VLRRPLNSLLSGRNTGNSGFGRPCSSTVGVISAQERYPAARRLFRRPSPTARNRPCAAAFRGECGAASASRGPRHRTTSNLCQSSFRARRRSSEIGSSVRKTARSARSGRHGIVEGPRWCTRRPRPTSTRRTVYRLSSPRMPWFSQEYAFPKTTFIAERHPGTFEGDLDFSNCFIGHLPPLLLKIDDSREA